MKLLMESTADLFPIIFVVVFIGFITFSSDSYTIESDSPNVYWIKKSWWGLSKEYRPVKWFNGAWHTRAKNGEWYVCIVDDDSEPAEQMPAR